MVGTLFCCMDCDWFACLFVVSSVVVVVLLPELVVLVVVWRS